VTNIMVLGDIGHPGGVSDHRSVGIKTTWHARGDARHTSESAGELPVSTWILVNDSGRKCPLYMGWLVKGLVVEARGLTSGRRETASGRPDIQRVRRRIRSRPHAALRRSRDGDRGPG